MTEETTKEIVKSFAYGLTAEQVAENEGLTLEETKDFQMKHAGAIDRKKNELKEGGWLE